MTSNFLWSALTLCIRTLRAALGFYAFCFLFFALIVFLFGGALPLEKPWQTIAVLIFLASFFLAMFLGLGTLLNYLHIKKHGVPHPAITRSRWAL